MYSLKIMKIKKNKNKQTYCFVPMYEYFHHGHANINKAKKYGNIILGLMSDEGISSYKKKPHIPSNKEKK